MSEPTDVWTTSRDGTRIHAYEWGKGDATAIVFVPGGTGNAWMAEPLVDALASERRIVSVSRRGMGLSSTPSSGYTPAHFADDVEAVVKALRLNRFVYFGQSMGVPIGLEYVLRRPAALVGVVLGDAPAMYIDFASAGTFSSIERQQLEFDDWEECFRVAGLGNRERFDGIRHRYFHEQAGRIRSLIDLASINRTVEESKSAHTDYWLRLKEIEVPVLLLHATLNTLPVLTDEHVELYRRSLPSVRVHRLSTDHSLGLRSDPLELIDILRRFLAAADTSVRRATDDDVPALTRLINAAYRALGEMGLNFTGVSQDEATTRTRMNGCDVFVIERQERLVGTVKLKIRHADGIRYAELTQLAVDPAQQHGGLGTRLVGLVEQRATELGVDRVRLDTAIRARDLVRWYERRGYAAIGQIQREGKNYRSVILEKVLC